MASNILYVVTDQRAILIIGTASMGDASRPSRVASTTAEELLGSEVTARADGSGDLLFPRAPSVRPSAADDLSPRSIMGFYGIADVKGVEELVRGMCKRQETAR